MEINELRIGSYFHPCDTKGGVIVPNTSVIWQVGMIDKFGKIGVIEPENEKSIFLPIWECSPVLITPELLTEFGATLEFLSNWTHSLQVGGLKINFRFNHFLYSEVEGIYLGDRIKYLHQLQNLYFSLSGVELIKKKPE